MWTGPGILLCSTEHVCALWNPGKESGPGAVATRVWRRESCKIHDIAPLKTNGVCDRAESIGNRVARVELYNVNHAVYRLV